MTGRRATLGAILLVAAVGSIAVSVVTGTPKKLPDVALDSPVLLHAIRSFGIFLVFVVVFAIVVRGFEGRLPDKFGREGVEYTAEKIAQSAEVISSEVAEALKQMRADLDDLEGELRLSATSITQATTIAMSELEERITLLEASILS